MSSEDYLDDVGGDVSSPDVLAKYRKAAEVANNAIATVVAAAQPGTSIHSLCVLGDKYVTDTLAPLYPKEKEMSKGLAFPTCVSVNNCLGHFSPLETDKTVLEENDTVKIDIAVQIDGYISTAAHTIVCKSDLSVPITGKQADVICAAYFAAEAALRLLKPGKTNHEVTEMINAIAKEFDVRAVSGVLSHKLKQDVIDGNDVIMNASESADERLDTVTFEKFDTWSIDIIMSTGEGKGREQDSKATIYKRSLDTAYSLKRKASRAFYSDVTKQFGSFPFCLRNVSDPRRAFLGVKECVEHDLVHVYPVLYEKEGEHVAQFKFTAVITQAKTTKLNEQPLPYVSSELSIKDASINALLATSTKGGGGKKKNRRRKKKAAGGAAAAE